MSLEAIFTRIKTINSGITGITRAYDHTDVPESLSTGDLPAAIPYPDTGDIFYSAGQLARFDHRILIRVYVAPTGQANLAQNLSACLPFVQRFRDTYAQAMKLNELAGIEQAKLTSYRVGVLPDYAGVEYVGVEFVLEVAEEEAITTGT